MKQLNYNHLQYFLAVAKEGSVTRAAEVLNVRPQTVSGQIATFEEYIGAPLFERHGKRLTPNDLGKLTLRYADDIFQLGRELSSALAARNTSAISRFSIGVVDAIPKFMAFEMLNECFDLKDKFVLDCQEGDFQNLLADLSVNKLDLVLSDQPLPVGISVRATNHYLGESGMTFFSHPSMHEAYSQKFPDSLHQAPFLMPGHQSALNRNLLSWFSQIGISPEIVAEFEDSALLQFFGQIGRGVFCVATCVEHEVLNQFDVSVIGRTDGVSDRFYALTPGRKIDHPVVKKVLASAGSLFKS
ncbi:MAG: transcriptional activator NhaR [Acidiferrobacterales bacterium]|nr:transcriptional activator NhaR [Acidiferrobacterales bacterium]